MMTGVRVESWQRAAVVDARAVGQHDVQQDQVGLGRDHELSRLGDVGRADDDEALDGETYVQRVLVALLVLDAAPGNVSGRLSHQRSPVRKSSARRKRWFVSSFPRTPNPTSGFMVLVPESQVTKLDMSVANGIKFIISLGSISPELLPRNRLKPAPAILDGENAKP